MKSGQKKLISLLNKKAKVTSLLNLVVASAFFFDLEIWLFISLLLIVLQAIETKIIMIKNNSCQVIIFLLSVEIIESTADYSF